MQIHEDTARVLRQSEFTIRQLTRSRDYWLAADELAKIWFGSLFMPDPLIQRALINLNCAIDTLYENCAEGEAYNDVLALGDELSAATLYTGREAGASAGCDLLSATKAIIGTISHEGKTLLDGSNLEADAAEKWWMLWCKVLHEHNRQQGCSLRMLQDAHFPVGYALTSFMGGVEAYLNDCAETIGGSPIIVGIIPFATKLQGGQISEMIHVLRDSDLLHTLRSDFGWPVI
jgi:hypothetical protein